jgi:hypothetical protein
VGYATEMEILLKVFGDSSAQALDADGGLQLYGGTLSAAAHFAVDAVLLADEQ